jgi:hypothetical protein
MRRDRWSRDNMPTGTELDRIQHNIDATMRGAIADAYHGISNSASMIPDRPRATEEPSRAPSDGIPIGRSDRPPGINYIDQMCDAADKRDRAALIKEKAETERIMSHLGASTKTPRR